jgi:hypothetical protein
MNIERLQSEADRLRNWDNSGRIFNMSIYAKVVESSEPRAAWDKPRCQTTCCIAGDIYLNQKGYNSVSSAGIHDFALEYLNLTRRQAFWLFSGKFTYLPLSEIKPELAAKAIDFMITNNGCIHDNDGFIVISV